MNETQAHEGVQEKGVQLSIWIDVVIPDSDVEGLVRSLSRSEKRQLLELVTEITGHMVVEFSRDGILLGKIEQSLPSRV